MNYIAHNRDRWLDDIPEITADKTLTQTDSGPWAVTASVDVTLPAVAASTQGTYTIYAGKSANDRLNDTIPGLKFTVKPASGESIYFRSLDGTTAPTSDKGLIFTGTSKDTTVATSQETTGMYGDFIQLRVINGKNYVINYQGSAWSRES